MQSASFSNSFLAELESFLLLVSPSFSRNATLALTTRWVRGHTGERYNERADALAGEALAARRSAPKGRG